MTNTTQHNDLAHSLFQEWHMKKYAHVPKLNDRGFYFPFWVQLRFEAYTDGFENGYQKAIVDLND